MRKAALLAPALVLLMASSANAVNPPIVPWASQAFGGTNHRVDTNAEVKTLIEQSNASGNAATLETALKGLTPTEAAKVVADGLEVSYVVNEGNGIITSAPTAAASATHVKLPAVVRRASAKARRPMARASTSRAFRSMGCAGYSGAGVHVYTYNQDWWWDWGGTKNPRVVSAGHAESPTFTALQYQYTGSQYLVPVGAMGTWYVGRQTQGTFRFSVSGAFKYKYQRETGIVFGDGSSGWQCQ
jgi:hypothetical protein